MTDYRVISSDSHVVEPPELWTARAEPELRHRVPQLVRTHGGDWWFCDGIQGSPAATGSMAGVRFDQPEKLSMTDTFKNVRPGAYIPEEHVKDMAIDGVDVGVIYPSAGLMLFSVPDTELVTAVFGIYNDWLAEFCGAFPDQLKGIGMVNVDDASDGVKELERCETIGLVGAMITVYPPADRAYDLPEYEPLWAAAEGMGMPLSFHSGTNRRRGSGEIFEGTDRVKPSWVCNLDYWVRMSLTNMLFSGVFERYPKLQVGSIEMELSWAPHFLDRMDTLYTQKTPEFARYRFKEDMLPSDYFHRNVFLGFQEDPFGIKNRDIIGVDNLMWGSDYPHQESTFPKSREILEEILWDCSEEEKAKIAGGNAARVYHID